jgi:polysaccharide biosynthesis protein PslH
VRVISVQGDPASSSRRRRVLVCTPFPPRLDARHGGKATAQLLLRLAERNDVALLALCAPEDEHVDPAIARHCVLVNEVRQARPGPLRRRFEWAFGLLRGVPPWATDCRSEEYELALERLADEWRPDVVEIHLQAMARYVDVPVRNGVPSILVDYDPASAWADDLRGATRGPRRLARRLEVSAWRRFEQTTRRRFSAIVVFAERDVAEVEQTAGGATVTRIPLAVAVPARALNPVGSGPPTVLFVGSFAHPPNVDGAIWLAKQIFPRVAQRVPEARLELVGHEPVAEVRALAESAIAVHASVPDVTPFLERASVVVAPIRMGGSMRMKVLEALAAGKAVVATPRAAEGVETLAGEVLLIAASDDDLVKMVSALLLDPERRRRLGENARRWAESNLGWDGGVAAFEELYDAVIGDVKRCA